MKLQTLLSGVKKGKNFKMSSEILNQHAEMLRPTLSVNETLNPTLKTEQPGYHFYTTLIRSPVKPKMATLTTRRNKPTRKLLYATYR